MDTEHSGSTGDTPEQVASSTRTTTTTETPAPATQPDAGTTRTEPPQAGGGATSADREDGGSQ
jgi:hypothetical protein